MKQTDGDFSYTFPPDIFGVQTEISVYIRTSEATLNEQNVDGQTERDKPFRDSPVVARREARDSLAKCGDVI